MPPVSSRTERFGDETLYVLADGSGAEARVAPSLGFNCLAFRTPVGDHTAHLISSPASPDVWRQRPTFTGFPILSPYPGRHQVPFTWRGTRYSMEPNDRPGVAIHGIVAGAAWETVDATMTSVTGRFDSERFPNRTARWPWPFTLTATYTVERGALRLDLALENRSDDVIPHLLGLHPYFPIRFTPAAGATSATGGIMPTAEQLAGPQPDTSRETCEVFVLADELWEMRAGLGTGTIDRLDGIADLRGGRTVAELERAIPAPSGPGPFGDDAAVSGPRLPVLLYGKRAALRGPEAGTDPTEPYGVICGLRDRASGIEATLESSAGFGSLAIFFPPGRPFVSLEPRSAVSDALTLMNDPRRLSTGVHPLPRGETWKSWIRLYARPLRSSAS
jgi:galactose mutarotase-like enzyme